LFINNNAATLNNLRAQSLIPRLPALRVGTVANTMLLQLGLFEVLAKAYAPPKLSLIFGVLLSVPVAIYINFAK
jgi:hypothetical protein